MRTADLYRLFGRTEVRDLSPTYERLSYAVADAPSVVAVLDRLPPHKRQPNLLFAAARSLGAPTEDPAAFLTWVLDHREPLTAVMLRRRTQTNEPGRCAVLLPALARLPQPLALLEVGAAAGLCLYPDAYRYRYRRPGGQVHDAGPEDSPVRLDCTVAGPAPLPAETPRVVWRAGLDLDPLDATRQEDVDWLQALVWPEQTARRDRLLSALENLRRDPPHLVRGDLATDLPALAAQAPPDATLVIFHSAVLSYVPPQVRATFVETVAGLPGRWIANEALGVLPHLPAPPVPAPRERATFLLAVDGGPVGYAAPHGQRLRWF